MFLFEFGEDFLLIAADLLLVLPPLRKGVFRSSSHSLIIDGSLSLGLRFLALEGFSLALFY